MKIHMFVLIYLLRTKQIKSDSVKDSFNILMKDSAIYSVDEFLNSDDYEMIENKKRKNINQMLLKLNKLAMEEYKKTYTKEINNDDKNVEQIKIYDVTSIIVNKTKRFIHKRDIASLNRDYDYDELIKDYIIGFDKRNEFTENRDEMSIIGIKDLIYSINDTIRQPPKTVLVRFWNNLKLWLLVYLAVALPLWCTRGWSCCCLFCKLIKPQRIIEDAKIYFAENPPGVITLPNIGVIHYEATEREKESYEKFGHMIRTI